MSNQITVVGTIATDPKLVKTRSGIDLCSFRVASGDRRFDREQQKWVDGETNWFGITVFRALAGHAIQSFHKGERVIIMGRLRVRRWESGEKTGTSVDVEADALGHDVRWGVSRFERANPPEQTSEGGAFEPTEREGASANGWGLAPTEFTGGTIDGGGTIGGGTGDAATGDGGAGDVDEHPEQERSDDGFVPAAA